MTENLFVAMGSLASISFIVGSAIVLWRAAIKSTKEKKEKKAAEKAKRKALIAEIDENLNLYMDEDYIKNMALEHCIALEEKDKVKAEYYRKLEFTAIHRIRIAFSQETASKIHDLYYKYFHSEELKKIAKEVVRLKKVDKAAAIETAAYEYLNK